jgi:hypothetical protein
MIATVIIIFLKPKKKKGNEETEMTCTRNLKLPTYDESAMNHQIHHNPINMQYAFPQNPFSAEEMQNVIHTRPVDIPDERYEEQDITNAPRYSEDEVQLSQGLEQQRSNHNINQRENPLGLPTNIPTN